MFTVRQNRGYRAIIWMLVISSLACWELATSRFELCPAEQTGSASCKPLEPAGSEMPQLVHTHKNNHLQSHLLAITSAETELQIVNSGHNAHDLKMYWQPFDDEPPTPPPEISSLIFA